MKLVSTPATRQWREQARARTEYGYLESPMGRIGVVRSPIGGRREEWEFAVDGRALLQVRGLDAPGLPSARRAGVGVDATLLGEAARLTAVGSPYLPSPGRRLLVTAGDHEYALRRRWGQLTVRLNGRRVATRRLGRWRFQEPGEGLYAVVALHRAAGLETALKGPLDMVGILLTAVVSSLVSALI